MSDEVTLSAYITAAFLEMNMPVDVSTMFPVQISHGALHNINHTCECISLCLLICMLGIHIIILLILYDLLPLIQIHVWFVCHGPFAWQSLGVTGGK